MTAQALPTGPSHAVVKQLFAHSGNRCASPKCGSALNEGDTVVGEICHVKAASPKGLRYNSAQTPAERYSYGYLVLLCATHHEIIDDDEELYTVERLTRIKNDYTACLTKPEDNAKQGARILLVHSIRNEGQSSDTAAHAITTAEKRRGIPSR